MKFLPSLRLAVAACVTFIAQPVLAKALVDCPLRDAPYTSATPIIDLMLSPAATAAVENVRPGTLSRMPPFFAGTKPPTFAAIISLRQAAAFAPDTQIDFNAIDKALAAVPVSQADKIARCDRYDTTPAKIVVPKGKLRILLFEKITGFRDGPSVDGAHIAFIDMAKRNGWAIITTDKGSAFSPAILGKFDLVIWNNISGDVLTLTQRRAFQSYMEKGGGFLGVHGSAGDPIYFWDWYVDTLIGARFAGHPRAKQFQTARVKIDESGHPIAKGLPAQWDMNDEWYSFKNNPRASGSRIIATLDEASYEQTMMSPNDLAMGDHPIAWSRCVGKGRSFYSAIGHRPERYSDAIYVQMLEQAIVWAARDKDACKTPKTTRRKKTGY